MASKKDYILVAEALRAVKTKPLSPERQEVLLEVIDSLTLQFGLDNPRFSPSRFQDYINN